jgi:hypothetical protein
MWVASRWWSRALVIGGYLAVWWAFCWWAGGQHYPYLWEALALVFAAGLYKCWWSWVGWRFRRGAYDHLRLGENSE